MRLMLTLVMFLIVGATLTGSFVIALLVGAAPARVVQDLIPWVAMGGFLVSLPISYFLAGYLLKKTNGFAPRQG